VDRPRCPRTLNGRDSANDENTAGRRVRRASGGSNPGRNDVAGCPVLVTDRDRSRVFVVDVNGLTDIGGAREEAPRPPVTAGPPAAAEARWASPHIVEGW
jgi:hypothetical protein